MPNSEEAVGSFLSHHGILGQKWGVRRFQNKDGSYTAAGKKHRKTTSAASKYEKKGEATRNNLEEYTVGKIHQYQMPNGEIVRSALRLDDFVRQEIDVHEHKENTGITKEIKPDSFYAGTTFNHVISDPHQTFMHDNYMLTDEDLKECNPHFGRPGTVSNCAKCAATMELRLRGLDVHAGHSDFGADTHAMELWFPGAQRIDYSSSSVQDALSSYGPETSGTLSVRYPNNGGGHALHWTNSSNGEFEIQDGQSGERFSSFAEMAREYGIDMSRPVTTYRLDECAWDMNASSNDSVIRTDTSRAGPLSFSYEFRDQNNGTLSRQWKNMDPDNEKDQRWAW